MPYNASQYKPEERIFAMHVGRSGDGKSVAAASYPGKYLNLDFDLRFGGIASAINQGLLNSNDIEYLQFSPRGGWDPVQKFLDQIEMDRATSSFKYKSIEVASVTSLARLLLNYSKSLTRGKSIGKLRVSGPSDYMLESQGTHDFFDYLRTFPCNIIVSAHIVDKWGKPEPEFDNNGNRTNEFSAQDIIGERLSIRDNLGENILTYFNNVFKFSREIIKNEMHYFVEFSTDLAKNEYGIPPGKHDITNKQFFSYLLEVIKKYKKTA